VPTITRITQQKDSNRANIYLDGKFAFGLSLEGILQNNLKTGKVLSQEAIDNLRGGAEEEKVYNKVLRFVTSRPHSEYEIKLWFRRKKVNPEQVERVFDRLKNLDMVDDKVFARWWIEQRLTFRPKSQRALIVELRQKGVEREVIEDVLANVEFNEVEVAQKVAEKQKGRLKNLPQDLRNRKLSEYLARRGFSWEVVKQILAKNDKI
tara:strand:- start:1220 stop:1840 length:621 start_codon:yes stop_codon:yes gene_type:complete